MGIHISHFSDFSFWGSKITADGDCSHEIKRCLLLWRKIMTNLDSILKSRDITLPTKVRLVKAMVFPVVMYGCETLTVKKAERWKIDAFELWCWRRLLRVPWAARRSNQSILKEISPGCSLEGLMLKLKLIRRIDSLEKTLMLGGIGGRRRRGRQRMRWLDGITNSRRTWVWINSGRWWWTGRPGVLGFMGSQRVTHDWETEMNWAHIYIPSLLNYRLISFPTPISWQSENWKWSRPDMSDSLRPHGLQPTRLLPWDFPSKSTGVGCHFLLQGIFPTQGSNLGLPHCGQTLYLLSHQRSPYLSFLRQQIPTGYLFYLW